MGCYNIFSCGQSVAVHLTTVTVHEAANTVILAICSIQHKSAEELLATAVVEADAAAFSRVVLMMNCILLLFRDPKFMQDLLSQDSMQSVSGGTQRGGQDGE